MTEESCRKRLRDEGTCPICRDIFTDPVTLDCGHNFCSACIDRVEIIPLPYKRPRCLLCTELVERKKLRPNTQLANMIEVVQDLSNLLKHRSVCSVEEAEKEFAKDQINRACKHLMNERIQLYDYKQREERHKEKFHNEMKRDKEKTTTAFRQLHEFLNEKEKHFIAQTEAVEKEAGRLWAEHLAVISEQLSSLDSLINKLEEKLKKSSNELLRHSGDILERILTCLDADLRLYLSTRCKKEKFCKKTLVFPVALSWQKHDSSDIASFLEGSINRFKKSLVSGFQLKKAKVKLDPNTAHPSLVLSEDLKSVRWKDDGQDLPNNPNRFMDSPYVLGKKGFTEGRHFWDVAVSDEEDWSIGVVFKSVSGKLHDAMLMGSWDGEFRVSFPPHHVSWDPEEDLKKIRVTLNYAATELGFYNCDTGRYMCSIFSPFPYEGGCFLPCFSVSRKGHLTLCP